MWRSPIYPLGVNTEFIIDVNKEHPQFRKLLAILGHFTVEDKDSGQVFHFYSMPSGNPASQQIDKKRVEDNVKMAMSSLRVFNLFPSDEPVEMAVIFRDPNRDMEVRKSAGFGVHGSGAEEIITPFLSPSVGLDYGI